MRCESSRPFDRCAQSGRAVAAYRRRSRRHRRRAASRHGPADNGCRRENRARSSRRRRPPVMPGDAVLDHQALFGRDLHLFGGEQKQIGRGLAAADLRGGENMRRESVVKTGAVRPWRIFSGVPLDATHLGRRIAPIASPICGDRLQIGLVTIATWLAFIWASKVVGQVRGRVRLRSSGAPHASRRPRNRSSTCSDVIG